ncbi:protein UXT homolog [Eurytemora carolleeae]|uniref:protein UXT homolog n=1 Tax=Eurytemora carolleeae TaxID=1294199 RepID=UPI000C75E925|nr:protein UXT homolog [Eurytemora carolleeae]|eukprot:XP_023332095.1 protein UXT homolog [Eurytemora affinis]
MNKEEIREKILRYETHLNETLRNDLKTCLELRDKVYSEQAEFLALRNTILAIRESGLQKGEPLKTKVDLGCNFYCEAKVDDPTWILVSIGMGFFLEMTLPEALEYIRKKDVELSTQADKLTQQSTKIKTNIKLVIGGLKELQNISLEQKTPYRDAFA